MSAIVYQMQVIFENVKIRNSQETLRLWIRHVLCKFRRITLILFPSISKRLSIQDAEQQRLPPICSRKSAMVRLTERIWKV